MNHPISPRHIILIGMPACGKSTVGVLAAKTLGYRFIDSDLIIQERAGRKLHRIISEEGQAGFLALEEAVNLTLGNDPVPSVIATGGSVIYRHSTMEHLASLGPVLYLDVPMKTILERIARNPDRGLAIAPGQTVEDLFHERETLYRRYADVIVDTAGIGANESVRRVLDALAAFQPVFPPDLPNHS